MDCKSSQAFSECFTGQVQGTAALFLQQAVKAAIDNKCNYLTFICNNVFNCNIWYTAVNIYYENGAVRSWQVQQSQ